MAKTLESKPTFVQISSAWNSREGAPTVAHYLISRLSYNQIPAVAKRHKVEVKKDTDSGQELLAKQAANYDELELCRVLLEISLLDSAYRRSPDHGEDTLLDVAKRYRVDVEKLHKAVATEFDNAVRLELDG